MASNDSDNLLKQFTMAAANSPLDSPPPAPAVTVDFGARSRRGSLRPVNDDNYLVLRLGRHEETLLTSLPLDEVPSRFDEFGYGMVIADGLGRSGESASRLAIATLVHLALYFGRWNLRVDEPVAEEIMDRLRMFYRSVNAALLEVNRGTDARLQSTMTAVFSAGADVFFTHVGHSRAYLFRDERLVQLTHDHTLERGVPGQPIMVDVSSSTRDLHHFVTQSIGGPGTGASRIDIERFGLLNHDILLLCSNGLSDVVNDEQIAAVLRTPITPDDKARVLVDLAADAGGKDDTTVVVAQYRIPS